MGQVNKSSVASGFVKKRLESQVRALSPQVLSACYRQLEQFYDCQFDGALPDDSLLLTLASNVFSVQARLINPDNITLLSVYIYREYIRRSGEHDERSAD